MFDLIIMDIEMPVLNGFAACQLVKKHYQENKPMNNINTKIIAVSATSDLEKYKLDCQEAGFDDQFTSPITFQ